MVEGVVTEPKQFHLLELEGVEEVLGSAKLEPGQYQKIRFDIKEVLLDVFGNLWCAEAPSEKLVLDREFELVAGETTVLTLDFDPGNSISFRPGVGHGFDPAIKLLVREVRQSLGRGPNRGQLGPERGSLFD